MGTEERFGSLGEDEWTDRQRNLVAVHYGTGAPAAVSGAILRHDELFARWVPLIQFFTQNGCLPPADRELLILRTAARRNCTYQTTRHKRHALVAGLSHAEIERVPAGPDAAGWDAWQRTLLRVVDELCDTSRVSDERWRELRARYDDKSIIECIALVGQYQMLAGLTNSLDFTAIT
jgi:AhpD family alkylhydroperoxidase